MRNSKFNYNSQFKSCEPKKIITKEEYKALGGTSFGVDAKEDGHSLREICANCGTPYGFHKSGKIPFCPIIKK